MGKIQRNNPFKIQKEEFAQAAIENITKKLPIENLTKVMQLHGNWPDADYS